MSLIKHNLEYDEFWDDCLKDIKSKNNNDYIKINRIRSKSQDNKGILFKNYINNSSILKQKEKESNKRKKNKSNSINSFVSLYNRSMIHLLANKKNIEKIKDLNINNELSECSFHPKIYINHSLDKKLKNYKQTKIYQRGIKYQENHLNKLNKIKEDQFEETYSFTPKINNVNLNKVFYNDNIWNNQINNDTNKMFIFRQMKAREEKNYKKKRILNDLSKKAGINWKNINTNLKKHIKEKDIIILQQALHETLLNQKEIE